MEDPKIEKFVLNLWNDPVLSTVQQENVSRLIELSGKFRKKAGISPCDCRIGSERTAILESGHQPNFLPHSGTWKKAFLLHRIQEMMIRSGRPAIGFFGLADQNISTARILAKNQVPALNKNGYVKIGFKVKDADKQKSFNRNEKPTPEQWQKEITAIGNHYRDLVKKTKSGNEIVAAQWDEVLSLLWKSYERAGNFAELNALIFVSVCHELFDINLSFFLYSDMHHANLFMEESRALLRNIQQFNRIYNQAIAEKSLEIPPVAENHLPFWYECECGVKLDLFVNDSMTCNTVCPACNKEYEIRFGADFNNLGTYYPDMDFNAVSRNIIMAHGLCDTLFLSGTGGSLQYGRISDRISDEMGYHKPVTLAWRSKDYYLGMMHKAALHELMRTFFLEPADFTNPSLKEKIEDGLLQITRKITEAGSGDDQKARKYWTGMRGSATNLIGFSRNLFSATPSILDLLANYPRHEIVKLWEQAIMNADIRNDDTPYRILTDIWYPVSRLEGIPAPELPRVYEQINNLGIE